MRRIKAQDTKPELVVGRLLYAAGYRYRLHAKDLPGKPDLVFRGRQKAIFVHGCFWHQHDKEACLNGRKPKTNTGYWYSKLDRNVQRDSKNQASLRDAGWSVMTI